MVVSIICFLAIMVISSLASARAKARDATRIAQMTEVQKGLDVYFILNGRYPNPTSDAGCGAGLFNAPWLREVSLSCNTRGGKRRF